MAIKKQAIKIVGTIVSIIYPTLGKEVNVDTRDLTEGVCERLMLHGLGQKLGDAASGKDPEEKYEMASRIKEALLDGKWNLDADRDNTAAIVSAVAELLGVTDGEVYAALDANPDKITEWKNSGKVKVKMSEMRTRKLEAAAADADEPEVAL